MSTNIGYIAAAISCCAFGSFAVPIKGKTANRVNIDPLVMQTYKTIMCFFTSLLVLAVGVPFQFSSWGLLSGLFWVPGGTAGIFAVRNAGLALSQGTWSTLKVIVGFVWGIFIFKEDVRSKEGSLAAVVCMMVGLWGMSYFSGSERKILQPIKREGLQEPMLYFIEEEKKDDEHVLDGNYNEDAPSNIEERSKDCENQVIIECTETPVWNLEDHKNDEIQIFTHFRIHRRKLGLLCACFDGLWGGSILVPMHFAKTTTEGLGYAISFSIGASAVLTTLWLIRFLFDVGTQTLSIQGSWQRMPTFHFSCMWLPGGIAGLLWSIGNFASMVSVQYLGEGVGYSIVQAQMLVAGLWGILWYREVQGWRCIVGWFLFAGLTFMGILLLSYEHQKD